MGEGKDDEDQKGAVLRHVACAFTRYRSIRFRPCGLALLPDTAAVEGITSSNELLHPRP